MTASVSNVVTVAIYMLMGEGYRCYKCRPGSGLYKSKDKKQCRTCRQIKLRTQFRLGSLCIECQRRQIRRYGITELQYAAKWCLCHLSQARAY